MFDALGDEIRLRGMDENDLLYAIMGMDLVLRSGASIETAIEYVASHDYGIVSFEFKRVITEVHQGEFLDRALRKSSRRVKNKLYDEMARAMVRSIVTSAGATNTLRQIALRETQLRRRRFKNFLEMARGIGEMFVIIGVLIPLILGIVVFTSDIMGDSQLPGAPSGVPSHTIDIGYALVIVILVVIVGYVAAKAPKV
jgi:flagellar protein FlaJ